MYCSLEDICMAGLDSLGRTIVLGKQRTESVSRDCVLDALASRCAWTAIAFRYGSDVYRLQWN